MKSRKKSPRPPKAISHTQGPEPAARAVPKDAEAESVEGGGHACPVVGFGASAGGLEAMSEVLREMPCDLGMAIVFVQHLDPKHSSMLKELLSRATSMPVKEVTNGLRVAANQVYVIAPNTCIAIREGGLFIEPRNPGTPHMPVDSFFRSLAEEQGSKAIGVVLSGTASDGTLGLKAIKQAGGFTFAQEPGSAKYDGMPRSAIAAGCVDSTLPPQGIASELSRLCRHPFLGRDHPEKDLPETEKAFEEIMAILRTAKGVDFKQYKQGTVRRRTLRRMAIHRLETPEQYAKFMRSNREEVDLLFNDILIHVTSFFRESSTFSAIAKYVLPAILAERAHDDPIRIWVPGCATGEEAYSVAICVLEHMRQAGVEIPIQVFGTDLSEAALEQARAGVYPQSIEADVSPERMRRFFAAANGMYHIARSVRDVCIFARQNVTKDPPFSKLDLITCRNVLIYLGHASQSKVLRLFHYALKPTGYLVLGASETIGDADELFAPVERQHKIYSKKPIPAIVTTDFSAYEERRDRQEHGKNTVPLPAPLEYEKRIDQMILSRYAPPAVVVDSELRVLHFRGDTSPYLRHAPGSASLNLNKLARGNLAAEVRRLLKLPDARTGPVKSKPITLSTNGSERRVAVSVLPVVGAAEPQYLITFEEAHGKPAPSAAPRVVGAKGSALAKRTAELEEELATTKRYLHTVIEEQEVATEELKSAHEEVQSANEELQSTNEELLTAKEELQSTNEELTTVNDEMQSRNADLRQINNDLLNVLSSVNIPIVMLDGGMRIRRFTPNTEKLLNILPGDIGRKISDFRPNINVPDLVELCHEVADTLVPREREVEDTEGRLYSMWVRPYRTADNRIDGVVVAMLDVTERKQAAEARYKRLFEASRDGIVIADASLGEIVDCNPFVTKLFGYPRTRLVGVKFWESELFRGSEIDETVLTELQDRESKQMSLTLATETGRPVAVDVIASLFWEGSKRVAQFNIRDVSARKRAEELLNRNAEELREAQKMEAVGRLAGSVAHDFNNILTAVIGYTDLLRSRLENDQESLYLLDQVRHGADRASAVTKQLLAFGRKQIVSPTVIDTNSVINEMQKMVSVVIPMGIEMELHLDRDLGRIRADRTQLEQVVLNLVLNARDAMPEGGKLTVSSANVDADEVFAVRHPTVPEGKYVSITVRDTGIGMDPETQARMFEPFFTTKTKGKGVGLGLSTVYNIVKQNGGYIRAFSEMGVGTTFTVYLPRIEAEATVEAAAPLREEAGGAETILLVEDERPVRELGRRFLEGHGYEVLEAASGPDALRIARERPGPIHLMVTDVVMPRMSGRELALQLATERPDMKVLYMSGHTEDAIIHHGVLEQGVEFLQKPFTGRDLIGRVRRILDRGGESEESGKG